MERKDDLECGRYTSSPGRIRVAWSRSSSFIDVQTMVYGFQLISLLEETMWPQLMCCALSNPLSSQFRAEVGMSGGNRPEGQGSVYSSL